MTKELHTHTRAHTHTHTHARTHARTHTRTDFEALETSYDGCMTCQISWVTIECRHRCCTICHSGNELCRVDKLRWRDKLCRVTNCAASTSPARSLARQCTPRETQNSTCTALAFQPVGVNEDSGFLGDHDDSGVGVARHYGGHDGSVNNT